EGVGRPLHQRPGAFLVCGVVGVGHGPAAGGEDVLDHQGGHGSAVAAPAVEGDTKVVDHHRRALPGQLPGVGPAQPPPGAGDDRNPALAGAVHDDVEAGRQKGTPSPSRTRTPYASTSMPMWTSEGWQSVMLPINRGPSSSSTMAMT